MEYFMEWALEVSVKFFVFHLIKQITYWTNSEILITCINILIFPTIHSLIIYERVMNFLEEIVTKCKANGYVETICGTNFEYFIIIQFLFFFFFVREEKKIS